MSALQAASGNATAIATQGVAPTDTEHLHATVGLRPQVGCSVGRREIRVSDHGYDELAADGLRVRDLTADIDDAVLVEDYPEYWKGPCVLVLQHTPDGSPVHVVWGIPKGLRRGDIKAAAKLSQVYSLTPVSG